jgi:threonine/homoserine/homoserine lactone efflux protein
MTVGSAAALFTTMLVLSLAPGATEFALTARSTTAGRVHGLLMIVGIVIADFVFIVVAFSSLSAVAEALGPGFLLIQIAAGTYLIVLSVGQARAQFVMHPTMESNGGSWVASLSSGFLLTLGDPKAIFGYMGLLPAFVDLRRASLLEAGTVMLLATVAIGVAKTSYVVLAEGAVSLVTNPKARIRFNAVAACVLFATGAFLIGRGVVDAL